MIVVVIAIIALGVVGRWMYQSIVPEEDYKNAMDAQDMIEMRTMSNESEEYAEMPGRVLLPQSC